jgi:acyl phosphate:glycerol-3-phosphate acyltransferase
MAVVVAAVCGYLLGSIPVGLIVGRLMRGVDVREYGSGKTGFTNSLRVLGLRRSLPVLLGDVIKGLVAALLPLLFTDDPWARAAGAFFAVVGHAWPVFAGFRGGRGVLTGFGALLGLSPLAVLLVAFLAGGTLYVTRIASAASILGAGAMALVFLLFASAGWTEWAYACAAAAGSALVIVLHRDNIRRLLSGTEPRLGKGGGRRVGA